MAVHELRASEWLGDWYVLDGAPFGQPEGTAEHWREIIKLMRERRPGTGGRRVGVIFVGGDAHVYSPRNALGDDDCVLVMDSEIDDWIKQAEALLDQAESLVSDGDGI